MVIPSVLVITGLFIIFGAMISVVANWWTADKAVAMLTKQMMLCAGCTRCKQEMERVNAASKREKQSRNLF